MANITRKNPKGFAELQTRLQGLGNKVAKAGWFESSKYEDGTPVAYIASIHEFGVHINHPGGTPYKIIDGKATFVRKDSPGAEKLPVTKPHPIVIPPRPFMRPTVERERQNWMNYLAQGAAAVLRGETSADAVLEIVSMRAAADVAKTISQITSPPLKPSTIRARLRARSDKKTVGLLDKPLIDWGKLYGEITNTSVNHKVEDA